MSRFGTVLLDLDGTIVDAFTTIHRAYCHTLPQFGRPEPTVDAVRRAVGGGLEHAMSHFLPPEAIADACRIHLAYTDQILLEDVRLMPGTLELLRAFHEGTRSRSPDGSARVAGAVQFAVFTNKRGHHARLICDHLGVSPYLAGVFGARDTPWVKPQPEFAQHALTTLGARPETTLLIGDSPFDVKAAHAGGFACWCVTTGTHSAEQLRTAGAEGVYPDLHAVRAALEDGPA